MLGAAFGGVEEHRGSAGTKVSFPAFVLFPVGEIVAAPSLSFLSCGLAASRRYQPAVQGSAASPTWGSVVLLVIQHGAVIRDTAFPSPGAVVVGMVVCRYLYKHVLCRVLL